MPAKLPQSLIKQPPPNYTIETMPVGSEYSVDPMAMLVDGDGSCYLEPDHKIKEIDCITVKRDEVGYHVTVRLPGVRWTLTAIPVERKVKLIPVQTLTDFKGK